MAYSFWLWHAQRTYRTRIVLYIVVRLASRLGENSGMVFSGRHHCRCRAHQNGLGGTFFQRYRRWSRNWFICLWTNPPSLAAPPVDAFQHRGGRNITVRNLALSVATAVTAAGCVVRRITRPLALSRRQPAQPLRTIKTATDSGIGLDRHHLAVTSPSPVRNTGVAELVIPPNIALVYAQLLPYSPSSKQAAAVHNWLNVKLSCSGSNDSVSSRNSRCRDDI